MIPQTCAARSGASGAARALAAVRFPGGLVPHNAVAILVLERDVVRVPMECYPRTGVRRSSVKLIARTLMT